MANNNVVEVKYSRLIQKSGSSTSMPLLASGEIGFMTDAGRAFIGSDPSLSTLVDFNRVVITPFMNGQRTIQSYLDESVDYNHFKVEKDMTIDAGNNNIASELSDFINTTHRSNTQGLTSNQQQPIARVDSNIEFITNKNVAYYSQPWDFNVKYGAVDRINSFGDQVQYQLLDSTKGDLFLEYQYQNIFYMTVEYVLIQNNGNHIRNGMLTMLCDNTFSNNGNIVFKDEEHVLTVGDNPITFSGFASNGIASITFEQPDEQNTKIFYRINRWNIEDYVNINNYYEDTYIGPLSVNDSQVLNTGGSN